MHGYDLAAFAGFFTAVTAAAADLGGIAGAAYSAWVLLVEIVR